uniref:Cysteine proteinase inhibitor n=1 Tax=Chenopodium quinoa TaxID=63459 RepID=A0A803L3Z0_CHEQI
MSTEPIVGGIKQTEGSENSLEIETLAKFANALLEFQRVINTKEQVVAGTLYYITLEATDNDKKKVYEAKVWVKPWLNFKELQDFKYVGDADAPAEVSSS